MGPLSWVSRVTHPSGRCQLTSNPRPDARSGCVAPLQLGQFVGHGEDRGADLFLTVIGGDEEPQSGGVFRYDGVQNWLYVNASLEQSV